MLRLRRIVPRARRPDGRLRAGHRAVGGRALADNRSDTAMPSSACAATIKFLMTRAGMHAA